MTDKKMTTNSSDQTDLTVLTNMRKYMKSLSKLFQNQIKNRVMYTLIVLLISGSLFGASSATSNTITMDTQNPVVTLLTPNGGEEYFPTMAMSATWTASDSSFGETPINLAFASVANGIYDIIVENSQNTGAATFLAPNTLTSEGSIKVIATDSYGNTSEDSSDAVFSIIAIDTVYPAPNEVVAGLSDSIVVTFGTDMDINTMISDNIKVYGNMHGLYGGTFIKTSRVMTFTPDQDYAVGEHIQVILTRGIKINGGDSLAEPFVWEFTVEVQGGSGVFTDKTDYTMDSYLYAITSADFNGDGVADLAVANANLTSVSVMINKGNGLFELKVEYNLGYTSRDIISPDLNNDGWPDLALANETSDKISVMLNDGYGNFNLSGNYDVGVKPQSLSTSDFNGDGYLDIAVSNYTSNTLTVLMNSGNGTFPDTVNYAVGTSPSCVTTADLNDDGFVDIAMGVWDNADRKVSIFWNNGDGFFSDRSDYFINSNSGYITSQDLNLDGMTDLVVMDISSNIKLMFNNGDGTFNADTYCTRDGGAGSIVTSDLNNDGWPDLTVSNENYDYISIYMNNQNGTFADSVNYMTPERPRGMTASDLNGDGNIDLAVANYSSSVSVFFNRLKKAVRLPDSEEAHHHYRLWPADRRPEHSRCPRTPALSWRFVQP